MPVNTTHPLYDEYVDIWTENRDAYEGGRRVKAKDETYLPKLNSQTTGEYDNYKLRANWHGATNRTVQGYLGAIFRNPPALEGLDGVEEFLKDVTLTKVSFDALIKTLATETILLNRYGVLVEPGTGPAPRPRLAGYNAEAITNWRMAEVDGVIQPTLVVLSEAHDLPGRDMFSETTVQQYRVLFLDEDGRYGQDVWREAVGADGKKSLTLVEDESRRPILVRGEPLKYIPFYLFSDNPGTLDPKRPLLDDLVSHNYAHYRNSADHEHGLHYVGLPTPVVSDDNAPEELTIGSNVAWVLSTQGKAEMLEFKGDGLASFERAMEAKQKQMAVLGARLLESRSPDAEAAATVRLRQAGEVSVLQGLVETLSEGVTQLCQWFVDFAGQSPDAVLVTLNRDFYDAPLSPQELTALVGAWQSGLMSWKTAYYNIQRGELARPDVDAEEEAEEIANGAETVLREAETAADTAPAAGTITGPTDAEAARIDTQLSRLELVNGRANR